MLEEQAYDRIDAADDDAAADARRGDGDVLEENGQSSGHGAARMRYGPLLQPISWAKSLHGASLLQRRTE